MLRAGPLAKAASEMGATLARHGWIMDTYLLRRQSPARDSQAGIKPETGAER